MKPRSHVVAECRAARSLAAARIVRSANGEMGWWYHFPMSLDERAFFTDRQETRQGKYTCPKCRRTNEYPIRWVRRAKKDRLPRSGRWRSRALCEIAGLSPASRRGRRLQGVRKEVRNPLTALAPLRRPACRAAERRGTRGGDQAGIRRNRPGARSEAGPARAVHAKA